MVEGPGATRNGRKVQTVVGMVLANTNVSDSSTLVPKTKAADRGCKIAILRGRRLNFAVSVGKEVFLVFGSVIDSSKQEQNESTPIHDDKENDRDHQPMALRLHFGMNGVLTVRKQSESSKMAPWRNRDQSRCVLWFDKNNNNGDNVCEQSSSTRFVVETVATTLTLVSAAIACTKFERLKHKDVCGSTFDATAVLESICRKQDSMICDALLDQELFPGVGNIIKIESLHRAGIHPRRLVKSLSKMELDQTILECRNFSLAWLSTGRSGSKKVYNQKTCRSCQKGSVRMVKMGHSKRTTFWCESCQPLIPPNSDATLPDSTKSIKDRREQPPTTATSKNIAAPRPFCPLHGSKKLLLRRVRDKSSANLHRLFRTCRAKGCLYFCWADSHLPSCGCGKTVVLRASKTERTGGRWFLSCPTATSRSKTKPSLARSGKENNRTNPYHSSAKCSSLKSCSFFQWATPCQLAPFANDLSPLT